MRTAIFATTVCLGLTVPLCAGDHVLSGLLREGEVTKDGVVGSIDSAITNHVGGFAVGADIDGLDRIWGNATGGAGAILRTEQTIGNYEQVSFESFIGLADDGTVSYSPSCTDLNSGTTGLDGVWFGDQIVWIEEDPAPDYPGFFYSFGSRPGATSTVPYGVAGITDTQGGSTQIRALFIGIPLVPAITGGDTVANVPFDLATQGIDFDVRVSSDGSKWIMNGIMDSGSSTNDNFILTQDGGLLLDGSLVRELNAVPTSVGGFLGENWDNFDYMGVRDDGGYMFTGDTDLSDTGMDEFVLVDGQIVLREGGFVGGLVLSGSIESGSMNNSGDWAVVWDVDTDIANVEALIVNGMLIAKEGDPCDFDGDGEPDINATIDSFTGIAGMAIGANDGTGFNVYGTLDADVAGEIREMLYTVRIVTGDPCPCDFDESGAVDVDDLLFLLAGWGTPAGDCDGDEDTDVDDLLALLGAWGDC